MEQRSLRSCQALEPPHSVDPTIHQEFLDRSHGREVCPNPVPEILECVRIFSWEDSLKDEITTQLSYIRSWGGRFVMPIPEVSVI